MEMVSSIPVAQQAVMIMPLSLHMSTWYLGSYLTVSDELLPCSKRTTSNNCWSVTAC